MTSVDPVFAQWLQSENLWAVGEDANLKQRWGNTALVTDRATTLARREDAIQEAARQLAFRGAPVVLDTAELEGSWIWAIGQVITIEGDGLGYAAGMEVFVIAAEDDRAIGVSVVTFLRRL